MSSVQQRFRDHVVVCDGAFGSELLARVGDVSLLDLAVVEHAAEVLEIHLRYLEAGAEVLETATFAASRPRLERHRAGDQVERVNSQAVKLAREARDVAGVDCLIAGSIGPLAGVVDLDEPDGPSRIAAAHAEQASILAGRGADLLILETFFRVDELELAVRAVREVTELPLVGLLTFAVERPPFPYDDHADDLARAAQLPLLAVGVNCSPGPMGALEVVRLMPAVGPVIAAMPNAGVLQRRNDRFLMPPATPAYLAQFARQAVALGVGFVGGCCGTGPEHIAAMAEAVRGLKPVRRGAGTVTVEAPRPAEAPLPRPQSSLARRLAEREFVRLVQLDPPKGTNATAVLEAAERLGASSLVDALDVNSNPLARLRMDSLWLSAEIQARCGVETVPHITPRDASLMGLQSQLLGAWQRGVRNLLAISGDPSQLGDYPGVHDVYHVTIFELVRAVSRMAEGFDCAGNVIGEPPSFLLGVAVNPTADDPAEELDRLRRKADAGAHFAMSQVFFDWAPWERFLKLAGGTLPIPTLVAAWPLRSFKLALRLHHEVPGIEVPEELLGALERAGPDASRVGFDRAAAMIREAPRYAAGVYVIAPFKRPEEVIPLLEVALGTAAEAVGSQP